MDVPAGIRTEHVPNTSPECDRYANLLVGTTLHKRIQQNSLSCLVKFCSKFLALAKLHPFCVAELNRLDTVCLLRGRCVGHGPLSGVRWMHAESGNCREMKHVLYWNPLRDLVF
jgi:hypothetical protein